MDYKLQKCVLNGPMFTSNSFRDMIGKSTWQRLRKLLLLHHFPNKMYTCDICHGLFDESRKVDLHEEYSAQYDVKFKVFYASISSFRFLCRQCHLTHHQSYIEWRLSAFDKNELNLHIAKVNGISLDEAEQMEIKSVPYIKILNSATAESDDFYSQYYYSVETYYMSLNVDIPDAALTKIICDKLAQVHLEKNNFLEIPHVIHPHPPIQPRTTLPYLIDCNRLYEHRDSLFLSQEEVAEQCKVSARTYRNWESGQTVPSEEHLQKLVNVLQCTREFLLSNKENPKYSKRILGSLMPNLDNQRLPNGSLINMCLKSWEIEDIEDI